MRSAADAAPSEPSPIVPQSQAATARRDQAHGGLGACFTDRGARISLAEPDLTFAPGKVTLPNPRPARLQQLADLLAQEPNLQVRIEGYTDSSGTAATNQRLSAQRADAIKAALVDLGTEPARIQTQGLGPVRPVADNRTADGRSRNRRVEVYLIEAI